MYQYLLVIIIYIISTLGVTITELTARITDDFTLSMTPVPVATYNTADITVTGVPDTVIEGLVIVGQGVEAFISCITPNAAYNIEEPSCATVFIKGS